MCAAGSIEAQHGMPVPTDLWSTHLGLGGVVVDVAVGSGRGGGAAGIRARGLQAVLAHHTLV